MSVIKRGSQTIIKHGDVEEVLEESDFSLRLLDFSKRDIERRLSKRLSRSMAPEVVTIHIYSLSPLRYLILKSPTTPDPVFWQQAIEGTLAR